MTSYLPAHEDRNSTVFSRRFGDIADKVRLIGLVAGMKDMKVLVVTDKPVLGHFEPIPLQIQNTRQEYEETYLDNLGKDFGAELVAAPQQALFGRLKQADEREAEHVATEWIERAIALRGTNEQQVLASARLYVAMKDMLDEYECRAIATEGFGWPPLGFKEAVEQGIPCQCMPTTEFCTDGIVSVSETLTDCLFTQYMGLKITGSTGLLGDYAIDPGNGTAIIILGRSKIAIDVDAKALIENADLRTFGNHRTAYFGDYSEQFENLAKLIGYEVVDEDRA
ncbi:MAG: hypothetical protein JXA57_07555 [Armatimonadetes bacterium]|nr:hypothetical protein [Armatimonadota bacterium]